jgi:hypothetical protein
MIRNLSPREEQTLQLGHCPECHGAEFQPGPKGGAAQNYECVGCGARYNFTIHGGILLLGQAIGRRPEIGDDDWARYRAMYRSGPLHRRFDN